MDYIIRAMSRDGFVKAMAIRSTELVERARQIHKTTPTATAALGRLLTGCSMMGNLQKVENGALTLQVKGGGPLGTLLATSDAEGNVRGYVSNPHITLLEKIRREARCRRGRRNGRDAHGHPRPANEGAVCRLGRARLRRDRR